MYKAAQLILSEPFMADPNFQRSVVLLCEDHDLDGTVGYVLNQPTGLVISDLILDISPAADHPVFIGGPVGHEAVHFIHKCPDRLGGGTAIGNGIYWGGNFEQLMALLAQGDLGKDEIKFFLGYAGWDPGQLDGELVENSWVVCDQYNPDIVFVIDGENLWREALIAMGPKYATLANYPIDPRLN
ncbi:MAG TPA: YqgE/AlgH family protein [Sphingobacteriaceae bacterium]|nr:YqgE/AlgH family protein [Sphingobacteriaceae bacterium]